MPTVRFCSMDYHWICEVGRLGEASDPASAETNFRVYNLRSEAVSKGEVRETTRRSESQNRPGQSRNRRRVSLWSVLTSSALQSRCKTGLCRGSPAVWTSAGAILSRSCRTAPRAPNRDDSGVRAAPFRSCRVSPNHALGVGPVRERALYTRGSSQPTGIVETQLDPKIRAGREGLRPHCPVLKDFSVLLWYQVLLLAHND
ncbi:hypothetical protein ACRRTK_024159 [Alexandromys fortis]